LIPFELLNGFHRNQRNGSHPPSAPGKHQLYAQHSGCKPILADRWYDWRIGGIVLPVRSAAIAAIYFATMVSIASAGDYFIGFGKKIDNSANDRRQSAILTRRGQGRAREMQARKRLTPPKPFAFASLPEPRQFLERR
jgi:hypothetical protein